MNHALDTWTMSRFCAAVVQAVQQIYLMPGVAPRWELVWVVDETPAYLRLDSPHLPSPAAF